MRNLIGNKWMDASNGKTIDVINPANKVLIDTIPNSTLEDVDIAVNEAVVGQKEWAKLPVHERGRILLKFAEYVKDDAENLASLLSQETGKPIKEARAEIGQVQISVPAFVEQAKHLYGQVIPAGTEIGQDKTIQITERYPIGVVAAIIPFNFPIDLFGQKVPSALMMGNAVIVKPSTYNPLTLTKLVYLLRKAGVPAGAVEVLHGDGKTVGQGLARHKGVHLVSLTGSTAAGMETMETCSKNLTHVMLELGGNDAFILLEDGDIDLAVEEVVWGRMYNAGQVCCASKRFLIHNSVKAEFVKKLTARLKQIKQGDPSLEDTEMGCLINERAAKRVEQQVNDTIEAGAKLVLGGERNGAYYTPTILTNCKRDMDVMKDMEIFGPVVAIMGFDTLEEAVEIANQSSYGLCGNVFTRDMKTAAKVTGMLECGGVVINGASFYRSFEMPFGGWKHSGIGNEGVMTTLQEMSRVKTVVLKNIL